MNTVRREGDGGGRWGEGEVMRGELQDKVWQSLLQPLQVLEQVMT